MNEVEVNIRDCYYDPCLVFAGIVDPRRCRGIYSRASGPMKAGVLNCRPIFGGRDYIPDAKAMRSDALLCGHLPAPWLGGGSILSSRSSRWPSKVLHRYRYGDLVPHTTRTPVLYASCLFTGTENEDSGRHC